MVALGPAADAAPLLFELVEGARINTRLGVDDLGGRMEARALDGLAGRKTFVENPGDDAQEGGAQPRPARGAYGEGQSVSVEYEGRRHHALHPFAGHERSDQQVRL